MTSATGSQSYLAIIKQTPATPKVIPATPVMQKVNFISDDLKRNVDTKESDHIRSDRMNTDVTVTGFSIGGGYDFEFQYENSLLDELLAGFLWSSGWDDIGAAAVVDIEAGSCTTAGVLDLTLATQKLTNIVDGQKVKLVNTATSGANDDVYTLTETATNVYSMVPLPPANETFGVGVEARGSMIRNGVFYQPFFIERGHTDVAEYFKFVGMYCNVLSLSFADQSDVTGSFQFVGLTSQLDQTVESGATYTEPTDNPVFSTVTNIPSISIDGVVQEGCFVKEMDLEVNNNVAPKTGLGVLGACEAKAHKLSVTGKITMYFEDSTMYDRLIAGTAFTIDWVLEDADGNGYAFSLPRLKLSDEDINVTGVDDEVMDDAGYIATADVTLGCMIQIDKYGA